MVLFRKTLLVEVIVTFVSISISPIHVRVDMCSCTGESTGITGVSLHLVTYER